MTLPSPLPSASPPRFEIDDCRTLATPAEIAATPWLQATPWGVFDEAGALVSRHHSREAAELAIEDADLRPSGLESIGDYDADASR